MWNFFQFNVTHRINHLSFGQDYPGIVNPLDGHHESASSCKFSLMLTFVAKVHKHIPVCMHARAHTDENQIIFNQVVNNTFMQHWNRHFFHTILLHCIQIILVKHPHQHFAACAYHRWIFYQEFLACFITM